MSGADDGDGDDDANGGNDGEVLPSAGAIDLPCLKCKGCGVCIVHRPTSCTCAGGPR